MTSLSSEKLNCSAMLELFSGNPEVFELADGQTIIPVGSTLQERSLSATLPDLAGPNLPASIREDLERFLAAFPESSPEWPRILSALKVIFGGGLRPERLLEAVRTYFQIANNS